MSVTTAPEGEIEVGFGEHGGGGPGRDEAGVEEDGTAKPRVREAEFVDGGQHGAALHFPRVEKVAEFLGGAEIEAGERFIEQKNRGTLGDGAGEKDPLLLAAGQGAHGPVGDGSEVEFFESGVDLLAVGGIRAAEKTKRGPSALLDDTAHGDGEIPVDRLALGEVGEAGQDVTRVAVAEADLAGGERVPAEDGSEEGALARAVGPDQRGGATAGDVAGDAVERERLTMAHGDVAEAEDVVGGGEQG